jgi:hypothetical protein
MTHPGNHISEAPPQKKSYIRSSCPLASVEDIGQKDIMAIYNVHQEKSYSLVLISVSLNLSYMKKY